MRVLHVVAGNLYGGLETCLVEFAKSPKVYPEMEHDFACCFEGRLAQELRATGSEVHMLPAMRASRPWSVWSGRAAFRRLLEAHSYDVIIMHSCWCHALLAKTARRTPSKLILWGHGVFFGKGWQERLSRLTPPDRIIANSKFTASSIQTHFPQVPCSVVYCPLTKPEIDDPNRARISLRKSLEIAPDTVVILQASRIEAWKGQAILIEALSNLKTKTPWIALIAGGVQREVERAYWLMLQNQVDSLGLRERVRFLGQRRDVPLLLNAADIYCQPNMGPEPFGLVFIEALYAGIPVVTSAFGGALEIVDDSCGILVPPGDSGKLSDELYSLIDHRSRREKFGANGPMRANLLCDPKMILAQLHSVCQTLRTTNA